MSEINFQTNNEVLGVLDSCGNLTIPGDLIAADIVVTNLHISGLNISSGTFNNLTVTGNLAGNQGEFNNLLATSLSGTNSDFNNIKFDLASAHTPGNFMRLSGSLVVGSQSITANGANALAMGSNGFALGDHSFAGGTATTTTATNAFAFGNGAQANGAASVALGTNANVNIGHAGSMVFADVSGAASTTGSQMTLGFVNGVNLISGTSLVLASGNMSANMITGVTILSTNLYGTNITGSTITGTTLLGTSGTIANINAGTITGINILSTNLYGTNITGSTITGSTIRSTALTSSSISGTTITGNSYAILSGGAFLPTNSGTNNLGAASTPFGTLYADMVVAGSIQNSGSIAGAASTTSGAIALWNNTNGTALANSSITSADGRSMAFPATGNITFANSGTSAIGSVASPISGIYTNHSFIPRNDILLSVEKAYGTTGTNIIIYTNVLNQIGTALTYITSSGNGDSIVVNEDGLYSVTINGEINSAKDMGISLNANSFQVKSGISTLPQANRLAYTYPGAGPGAGYGMASYVGWLVSGDTLRHQTNAAVIVAAGLSTFHVVKLN